MISSGRPTAGGRPPEVPAAPAVTESRAHVPNRPLPRPRAHVRCRRAARPSRRPRAARCRPAAARFRRRPAPPVRHLERPLPAGVPVRRAPAASRRVLPVAPAARTVLVAADVPAVLVAPVAARVAVPVVAVLAPAASVAHRVVPAVVAVVATRTNCSRSSPPTRHPMRPSLRASSSSNAACRPRSSLRS